MIKGKGKDYNGFKGGKDSKGSQKGKGKDSKGTPAAQCYWCGKHGHMEKERRFKLAGKARAFQKGGTGSGKGKGGKNNENVNAVNAESVKRVERLELDGSWVYIT